MQIDKHMPGYLTFTFLSLIADMYNVHVVLYRVYDIYPMYHFALLYS